MTQKEIAELLKVLSANYGKRLEPKKAKETIDAWTLNLGELDTEDVYKAARLHMNESKFFPNPAELREKILKARLVYQNEPVKAIERPKTDKAREDYYLDELCKFVGLGCDPQDDADLIFKNFLPYEK